MIFDRLNNAQQYFSLNEKFKKAFDFLKENDLASFKDGKYMIETNSKGQEEIYANIQSLETKDKKDKKWEVHREYIDIQYVIKGQECMGYGILEDFKDVVVPYDNQKDVEFLSGEKFNFINVSAGDFVVFYPQDVHAPMLSVEKQEEIKKVIVKIKI